MFLLDTNVLSEFSKPAPNASVVGWLRRQARDELFLSVVTIGEVEKGIALLKHTDRRRALEGWLTSMLEQWFEGRVFDVDRPIAHTWGQITAGRQRAGRPLAVADGLIAATALHHSLTVATRNTTHFDIPGLKLMNPWIP